MPSALRPSPRYKFRNVEFWADKGRVWLLNLEAAADSTKAVTEKVITMAPGELLKRAVAIRASVGLSGADRHPNVRLEANKLLEDSVAVAKWAQFQGDPTDQRVLAYKSRHKAKNRLSMFDSRFSLPPLNTKYIIRGVDPRNLLLKGVEARPDLSVPIGANLQTVASKLRGLRA